MISCLGVFFSFLAVYLFKRYCLSGEKEKLLSFEEEEAHFPKKVIEITL
jgi:hypothetical protein